MRAIIDDAFKVDADVLLSEALLHDIGLDFLTRYKKLILMGSQEH